MHQIYIEHNPFTVETLFRIDGKEPDENSTLHSYKQSRLQTWVEGFFDDLREAHNGETEFDVEFKGAEYDFEDLEEAAEIGRNNGMYIDLNYIPMEDAEMYQYFCNTVDTESPEFNNCIANNYHRFRDDVEYLKNKDFNVYVVATTMSSGKSTLINAMLGQDLLPAANEATTATIMSITDDKTLGSSFKAKRITLNGDAGSEVEATSELLKKWNKMPDTRQINLRGNIVSMKKRDNVRLVLTDTPGPNNSVDKDHARVTMNYIQDSNKNPLILYILNGTQLGADDDKSLLNLIAEQMERGGKQSKDRFIFVVNKMDQFDPEKENISYALKNVKSYLRDNGIENPRVYPVSAYAALLCRKQSDTLPEREKYYYQDLEALFKEYEQMNLPAYMPLTRRVRRALDARHLDLVEERSGLPAIEEMIGEYINKYVLPHRERRRYNFLSTVAQRIRHEEAERRHEELQIRYEELQRRHEKLQKRYKKLQRMNDEGLL